MSANLLKGRRILVAGAGGLSGQAAARLALRLGATVGLSDRDASRALAPELVAGGAIVDLRPREDAALLDDFGPDLVLTAPGVPLTGELFVAARARGLPIRGESDFGFEMIRRLWFTPPLVVGVTGTDGKSTTTALLARLISSATARYALACGNIGVPLSDLALFESTDSAGRAPAVRQPEALVVELSSFQLELVEKLHPIVGMILNLADDHLDRYPDREAYLAAKLNLLTRMRSGDSFFAPPWIVERARAWLRARSPDERTWPSLRALAPYVQPLEGEAVPPPAEIFYRGAALMPVADLGLSGVHNISNVVYALAALEALEERGFVRVQRERLRAALVEFQGLPHRMERLLNNSHGLFINDSKATTVQAALAAVASYADRRVYLLCGGRDKGADFGPLGGRPNVRLFPFGEAAGLIAGATGVDERYASLETAFEAALKLAETEKEPPVILLSPACASYDAFRSYAERGERFRALVQARFGSSADD
jgi:UDP-N-acetylmuramoylalanine--D-glutamate ligase